MLKDSFQILRAVVNGDKAAMERLRSIVDFFNQRGFVLPDTIDNEPVSGAKVSGSMAWAKSFLYPLRKALGLALPRTVEVYGTIKTCLCSVAKRGSPRKNGKPWNGTIWMATLTPKSAILKI